MTLLITITFYWFTLILINKAGQMDHVSDNCNSIVLPRHQESVEVRSHDDSRSLQLPRHPWKNMYPEKQQRRRNADLNTTHKQINVRQEIMYKTPKQSRV